MEQVGSKPSGPKIPRYPTQHHQNHQNKARFAVLERIELENELNIMSSPVDSGFQNF
jgi:hypothetical protein